MLQTGIADALAVMHNASVGSIGVVALNLKVVHYASLVSLGYGVNREPYIAILAECLVLFARFCFPSHLIGVTLVDDSAFYDCFPRSLSLIDAARSSVYLCDALSNAVHKLSADRCHLSLITRLVAITVYHSVNEARK